MMPDQINEENEQEVLAINVTHIDRELFSEGYKAVFPYYIQKRTTWFGTILLFAGSLAFLLSIYMHYSILYAVPIIGVGLVILWTSSRLEKTEEKKKWMIYLHHSNEEETITRRTEFTDSSMRIFAKEQGPLEIFYEDLTKAVKTENLLVLQEGKRTILLADNGYLCGNAAEIPDIAALLAAEPDN